jgi:hypothetical protein
MSDKQILIFRIKPSRIKARELALLEIKSFLGGLKYSEVVTGGPLSTEKGVLAAYLPKDADIDALIPDFHKLGYIEKVEIMEPVQNKSKNSIKWKGQFYDLDSIYEEDRETVREQAPDKRPFLLPDPTGKLRYVNGYRGNGTDTGRRALPVEDCKMMLNIANAKQGQKVLDPFGGGGGIVFAAKQSGLKMYSSDIDQILQHGLRDYGAEHSVASVEKLPFDSRFFDAVVTEAPFDENTTPIVAKGLEELVRVTTSKASIVMMTGENQADTIRNKAMSLNLEAYIDQQLNRKGTPVHIFGWKKVLNRINELMRIKIADRSK